MTSLPRFSDINKGPIGDQGLELVITYSDETLKAAAWGYLVHKMRVGVIMVWLVILTVIVISVSQQPIETEDALPLGVVAIITAIIVIAVVRTYVSIKRQLRRPIEERQVRFRFLDDGMAYDRSHVEGYVPWRELPKVRCLPKVWLLLSKQGSYYALPTEALDARTKMTILQKVQENGGEAVRYMLDFWPVRYTGRDIRG